VFHAESFVNAFGTAKSIKGVITIKIICCYCQIVIGYKLDDGKICLSETVTHGICSDCYEAEQAKMEEVKQRYAQEMFNLSFCKSRGE
jgi:hypothetical protein